MVSASGNESEMEAFGLSLYVLGKRIQTGSFLVMICVSNVLMLREEIKTMQLAL